MLDAEDNGSALIVPALLRDIDNVAEDLDNMLAHIDSRSD